MSDVEDNDRRGAAAGDDSPLASPVADIDNDDALSDKDSDQLSDVDVDDLEDYDPLKANIETRPVEIDEDVAKSLKATKRKRGDADTAKKPKEGRRQKKRRTDEDDEVSAADGTIVEGKRRRGGEKNGGEKRSKSRPSAKASPEPEPDENLTPEQRRARAIERAMDAAMKAKGNKRRTKRDDIVGYGGRTRLRVSSLKLTLCCRTWKTSLMI